jgi:hypothetical protein
LCFRSRALIGFPGKKVTGNFKPRVEGMRIKHRVGRHWINMYDKFGCVLRVETVIYDPYGYLIRRHGTRNGKRVIGWFPMTKGVYPNATDNPQVQRRPAGRLHVHSLIARIPPFTSPAHYSLRTRIHGHGY